MDQNELIQMIVRIDERTQELLQRRLDQETRIRSLEKWRHVVLGITSAASILVGYFARYGALK
jgi:hypothetical protein